MNNICTLVNNCYLCSRNGLCPGSGQIWLLATTGKNAKIAFVVRLCPCTGSDVQGSDYSACVAALYRGSGRVFLLLSSAEN